LAEYAEPHDLSSVFRKHEFSREGIGIIQPGVAATAALKPRGWKPRSLAARMAAATRWWV